STSCCRPSRWSTRPSSSASSRCCVMVWRSSIATAVAPPMREPWRRALASPAIAAALLCAAAMSLVPRASHGQTPAITAEVMRARYGGRVDERAGCWMHRTRTGERLCMKPVGERVVSAHDGRRLYLLAEGLPLDANGVPREIGTHAVAGVVGAF